MNPRIQELAKGAKHAVEQEGILLELVLEKFAQLVVRECIDQCEQVAVSADAVSKSKFVTDAGRMLHEGMWGGAKNCSGQIKQHFGVEE